MTVYSYVYELRRPDGSVVSTGHISQEEPLREGETVRLGQATIARVKEIAGTLAGEQRAVLESLSS